MAKYVRFIGEESQNESPFTGRGSTWWQGEVRQVSDAVANALVSSSAGWELCRPADTTDVPTIRRDASGIAQAVQVDGVDWGEGAYFVSPSADTSGAADDAAMALAVAAAGVGGVIALFAGATYFTRAGWVLGEQQRLHGNGAVLQRAAQRVTTTATSITSGTTTTFIADASQFAPGDTVNFFNGYRYSKDVTIASIVGSTVTLSSAPEPGAASAASISDILAGNVAGAWTITGTTIVANTYITLDALSAAEVRDLVIDGNRSEYQYGKWDLTSELIHSTASVSGCEIRNFPGEGVNQTGSGAYAQYAGSTVAGNFVGNYVHDGGGNGLHLSATQNQRIAANRFEDLNEDLSVGHFGGAVTFSHGGAGVIVDGNVMRRCYAGLGNATHNANSGAKFVNNIVEDMHRYGVNATQTSIAAGGMVGIDVIGNTFKDCGQIYLGSNNTAYARLRGAVVANNILIGTSVFVGYADNVMISSNAINLVVDYTPTTTTTTITAGVTTSVDVASATNLVVGDLVRFGGGDELSAPVAITNIASLTLTVSPAVNISLSSGAVVYSETQRITVPVNGTVTSGDTTAVFADTSRIRVNQWIALISGSSGVAAAALRVASIDTGSGTVTFDGTISATLAAPVIASVGVSQDAAAVEVRAATPVIDGNVIRGGGFGVSFVGSDSATGAVVQNNRICGYRQYGIATTDTSASAEHIAQNVIQSSARTASWSWAVWLRGKVSMIANTIITGTGQTDTAVKVKRSDVVVDGNVIRASAGNAVELDSGTSGGYVMSNYVTQAIVDSGANTVSGNVTIV